MVNILDPREGESIYDPACGTGGSPAAVDEAIRLLDGRGNSVASAAGSGREVGNV